MVIESVLLIVIGDWWLLNIWHIFRVSCSSVIATVFCIVTGDCSRLKICLTFRVFLHKTWWIPKICLTVRVSCWSVIETGCVSSCHFRLSRTSENLPYFPGSVMNGYHDCVLHWSCRLLTSKNLSYYPGFIKHGDREGFSHCDWWLVTSEYRAYFPGFMFISNCNCFLNCYWRLFHVWKSVSLSGFFFTRLGEFRKSVLLSGFHFVRWSRLVVFLLATLRLSRTSENLPYFPGSVMNGYHDCVLHWNCRLLTS